MAGHINISQSKTFPLPILFQTPQNKPDNFSRMTRMKWNAKKPRKKGVHRCNCASRQDQYRAALETFSKTRPLHFMVRRLVPPLLFSSRTTILAYISRYFLWVEIIALPSFDTLWIWVQQIFDTCQVYWKISTKAFRSLYLKKSWNFPSFNSIWWEKSMID